MFNLQKLTNIPKWRNVKLLTIATITGESLDEFFRRKMPSNLFNILTNKLEVLARNGKDCIGAFVFPYDDVYYFMIDDTDTYTAKIFLSFIEIGNIILILDVCTY